MINTNRRAFFKTISVMGAYTIMPKHLFGKKEAIACEVCKNAWIGLSKFNANQYQFRYLEPTDGLQKVFIYGDSISIGYIEYVRASLEGKADVMRLHENGSSSNEFIVKMETFRKALFQPSLKDGWAFTWDIIHFNVGLHDLKYIKDGKLDKANGKQVSSLEDYKANLQNIISYLKNTYPKAKLIFATTTPVPDGEAGRFQEDAEKYNNVAQEVLKNHPEILVNDLYSDSISLLEQYAVGPGNVHYKPEGYRQQGIKVAKVIADALAIKPLDCPTVEVITAKFKEYEKK